MICDPVVDEEKE
jgi:hypothetical protein